MIGEINRLEAGNGDIGQVGVVNENETSNGSKIRGVESLHSISIKAKILGYVGERWKRYSAAVSESHIHGSLEQREGSRETGNVTIVGFNVQRVLDASNL